MVRIYMYIHVKIKSNKFFFKHEFKPYSKEGIILTKSYGDAINILTYSIYELYLKNEN